MRPIICGVVELNTGRIVASSNNPKHKTSSRLLARQLDTIKQKELGQFKGYGKRYHYDSFCFNSKSYNLYYSSLLKDIKKAEGCSHTVESLKTAFDLYEKEQHQAKYNQGLEQAEKRLDEIEQGIYDLLGKDNLYLYYTGDSYGIYDECIKISTNVDGIEYERILEL